MDDDDVALSIERIAVNVARTVMAGEGLSVSSAIGSSTVYHMQVFALVRHPLSCQQQPEIHP